LEEKKNKTLAITWRISTVVMIRINMDSHIAALGEVGQKGNIIGMHLEAGVSDNSRKENNILFCIQEVVETCNLVKVKVTLRLTVSQSVGLGVEPHLGLMTKYLVLFDSYGLVFFLWGALSDERAGLSFVRVTPCICKSFVIM
jgi:hypothetical protein